MELSATFPFLVKDYIFCESIFVGCLNNSRWTFRINYNSTSMRITRSNSSQMFEITVHINFYDSNIHLMFDESFTRTIDDGKTSLLYSFEGHNFVDLEEITGILSISQLPASSSKKTPDSSNSSTKFPLVENLKLSTQISDDFLSLLNNPDSFPDATLKCGAEKILVHKCILSARSPVFAAMFKDQMQEGINGIVEILDIEPNVLLATFKYVYSGKTDHLTDTIAGEMLFVADKYQLEELKKVCIDKLKSSVTVDNVFRILVLGDLHDECLKMHAKEFICKCDKFSNLEKTAGWKLFQSENPGMAMEVVLFVVKYLEEFSTKSK